MAGMSDMLMRGSGSNPDSGAQGPPNPDEAGGAPTRRMSPDEGVKVLRDLGISPRDLPMVAEACEVVMEAMQMPEPPDEEGEMPEPEGEGLKPTMPMMGAR